MATWSYDKEKDKYRVRATNAESVDGTSATVIVTKKNNEQQVVEIARWSRPFYDQILNEDVRFGYTDPDSIEASSKGNGNSNVGGKITTLEQAVEAANSILAYAASVSAVSSSSSSYNKDIPVTSDYYANSEDDPF